ncbi:MAG: aminoacyl-histidine dipeptidase [Bacteroidales bacterium]
MKNEITSLQPASLWQYFYELTQIPRPSKKEQKVVQYLADFGNALGLHTQVDKVGNVLISKPATKGMEKHKAVVLQSHVDMVPQKNNDTQHDFEKDPITAYIDGEWVRAKGTTLGADNGIGVAATMALLAATDIPHPAIEGLFTIDEETGMTGAFALQPNWVKGDILLNLDSEDEGELCIGCAGGLDGSFTMQYKPETPAKGDALTLVVKGLKGGHSGVDIALGRGNANKIMARLLKALTQECNVQLASFEGGNLRNAIPREAVSVLVVPTENLAKAKSSLEAMAQDIKNELSVVDEGVFIAFESATMPTAVMPQESQLRVMNAICACPNGVVRMSDTMHGLVETSTNLAIVRIAEGKMSASCLMRSAVDSAKEYLAMCMEATFSLAGIQSSFTGGYPGWKPNPKSAILKVMEDLYLKMYKTKAHVRAVHAGLECGLLGGIYPTWDMISCGPTIVNPHSPDERVDIASVEKWWNYLLEILKNVPVK